MRKILPVALLMLVIASATTAAILTLHKNLDQDNASVNGLSAAQEQAITVQASQSAVEGEPGTGLWLAIRPTGFEPTELTLPAGRYFTVINNATGLDQFAFHIDLESGERVFDVQVERYQRRWKKGLDLKPGRYVITESNHPDWKCVITVTNR